MEVKDITNISDLCYTIKHKVARDTDAKWLEEKIKNSGFIVHNIDYATMYDNAVVKCLSKSVDESMHHVVIDENSVLFADKVEVINFGIRNTTIDAYVYRYVECDANGIMHIYVAIGDKYAKLV